MQAERDHLVRFVFPRLRERLLPRRIHLLEVDLRWGVSSEQDTTEICREIITECRPRFMCMLGGRYGTVPEGRDRSITADEVHFAALDERREAAYAIFYFRHGATTTEMDCSNQGAFREPRHSDSSRRLAHLKREIRKAGRRRFVYRPRWSADEKRLLDLSAFGDQVELDVMATIDDELGHDLPPQVDEFEQEAAAMEAFAEKQDQNFVLGSRSALLDELCRHAMATGNNGYLCLVGDAGMGKSALLAQLSRKMVSRDQQSTILISHFVGASRWSTDVRRTVQRICQELRAKCPEIETEVPAEPEQLVQAFRAILAAACECRRVVIVLDALNQFDLSSSGLHWLPRTLPRSCRVILSALPGPTWEHVAQRLKSRVLPLESLSAGDGETIISQFLHRYRKRLAPGQRFALLGKAGAGTPLYLLTALEELRTLGTYEEISNRIAELPPTIVELFAWILRRLEDDDGFRDRVGRRLGHELVPRFAALLGASRHGLSQRELQGMLVPVEQGLGAQDESDRRGNVAALVHLLRPYLLWRGELLDFHHSQFREAVVGTYLAQEDHRLAADGVLVGYFERQWAKPDLHALSELPFHCTRASQFSKLSSILSDLKFIEAKCAAELNYELQDDYGLALSTLPEGQVKEDLVEFSKAFSQEMPCLMGHAELCAALPFADLVFQQMRNRIWNNTGGRIDLADQDAVFARAVLMHRRPASASKFLRRIDGDPGTTVLRFRGAIRFSPAGDQLFVAVLRPKILCIDPASGRELFALHCVGRVASIDFSADGSRLIVGGDSGKGTKKGFIQVFDLAARESIVSAGFDFPVILLVVTANDEIVTSRSGDIQVLSLGSLQLKHVLKTYERLVSAIAINRQRTLLATGEMHDEDRPARISVWDTRTMRRLAEFKGPKWAVNSLAFSDLGGVLASGSCHVNNGVIAWAWQLPGTRVDEMLLSAQHRQEALDLLKSPSGIPLRLKGRIVSTLTTTDSVNGIAFFPESSWVVAVEGSQEQASDVINVFDVSESKPGDIVKVSGNPSAPIAVDVDCQTRWVAILHAKGEIVIWPAEGLRTMDRQAPPKRLTHHSTDLAFRYVLSVEDDPHELLHITDIETGKDLCSRYLISSNKAAMVPTGKHFVRCYWKTPPFNPFDAASPDGVRWWENFLSETPVCITVHRTDCVPKIACNSERSPAGISTIADLDLCGRAFQSWAFPPRTQALGISFSLDGKWGASVVGSPQMPAHIFCFAPDSGETRQRAIPPGIVSGTLVFDSIGLLYLLGWTGTETEVACFDITTEGASTEPMIYRGFGRGKSFTTGPLPMSNDRFVGVRGDCEIVYFESCSAEDRLASAPLARSVTQVAAHEHTFGVFAMAVSRDGYSLFVSDGYPAVSVFQIPSFRLLLWRPMDQVSTDLFLGQLDTRVLAVGKLANLNGVHFSLMDLPSAFAGGGPAEVTNPPPSTSGACSADASGGKGNSAVFAMPAVGDGGDFFDCLVDDRLARYADYEEALARWHALPLWKRLLAKEPELPPGFVPSPRCSATAPREVVPSVGRNGPCPCNSGKRYKECHGKLI